MIWSFLLAGVLVTKGVTVTKGVSTEVVALVAVPSWASSMQGVWYLEEGTTTTRVSSGSCTTACGLTRTGDTTTSTDKMQGTYSNTFDGTDDTLTCTNANCGSSLGVASVAGAGGSVSWGCWHALGPGAAGTSGISGRISGSAGYNLSVVGDALGFGNNIRCTIDATSVTTDYLTLSGGTTPYLQNTFQHGVCSFNDSSNVLTAFVNGVSAGTAAPSSVTTNSAAFTLGFNSSGELDECFVYKGTLSAASACRICSCGIDGSLCTYDPTTLAFVNRGRHASSCGGCTMPADASAASPS